MTTDSRLLGQLAEVVGDSHVLQDEASRTFYSTDVYRQGDVLVDAVVQPASVDELRDVLSHPRSLRESR